MARKLESELARLWRIARRRLALLESLHGRPTGPIAPSPAQRLALIWERARARVLRWLRGARR